MKKFVLNRRIKIISITIIFLLLVYSFLVSSLNPIFKNEEFIHLERAIAEAQNKEYEEFQELYLKIYDDDKHLCPCEIATHYIRPYRHGFSPTKKLYVQRLNRKFTQKDCITFLLINQAFPHNNEGIEEASIFYFSKTLQQLSRREKITIIALLKNTSLYNPIRNPKAVENRVRILEEKLNNL